MQRTTVTLLRVLLTIVAVGQLIPTAKAQGILGLTEANWAALAVNGGIFCAQGRVIGNVGAVGNVIWQQRCTDTGEVILSGTFRDSTASGIVTGGVTVDAATVHASASNALAVSSTAAGLSCTLGTRCGALVWKPLTLNGGPGQNVLNVPGVILGNGSQLTINSPAGSTFIINISTLLAMLRANIVLTGGITPENVLINYFGRYPVFLGAGSSLHGIVLAPHATVVSAANVTPELIGRSIAFGGGTETGYVSDNFNRANGPVGPNWQDLCEDPMTVSSDELVDPSGSSFACGYWTANAFSADQFSQAQVPSDTGSDIDELLVRASGSLTSRQWYQVSWDGSGNLQVGFFTNSGFTPIATKNQARNAGDVLRFEAVGSALNVYVNGVLVISTSDGTLTLGSPGILVFGNAKFDNWSGGNLP